MLTRAQVLPALSISTDLATGRCLPDHTFGDLSHLASTTEPFAIGRLQLVRRAAGHGRTLAPTMAAATQRAPHMSAAPRVWQWDLTPPDEDEAATSGKAAIEEVPQRPSRGPLSLSALTMARASRADGRPRC